MGKTISCSAGPVAVNHDRRDYKTEKELPENVNPEMMKYNVYIKTCENAKREFNDFFKESVDEYNSRQTRADRKKKDYYAELQESKNGETAIYEYVFQIGNKDDTPCRSKAGMDCRDILRRYAKTFERDNPNFHVISSCIHMDEATPHLHIAFIPWAEGYKKGLKMRCSTSKALESMGYEGEERNMRSWKQVQEDKIENLMSEYGMERVRMDTKRERVEVAVYKELKDFALADAKAKFETRFEKKIAELNKNEAIIQKQTDKIASQEQVLATVHERMIDARNQATEITKRIENDAKGLQAIKSALNDEIKLKMGELEAVEDKIIELEKKKDDLELQELSVFKKFLESFPNVKKLFEDFKEKLRQEAERRTAERQQVKGQSMAEWKKATERFLNPARRTGLEKTTEKTNKKTKEER